MKNDIHKQRILILDFGSQVSQLIARRIREIGVYCEIWPWDVNEQKIKDFAPNGIILSGGPESTTEENSPRAPEYVFTAGVPVLGICYGMQTMAIQLSNQKVVHKSNQKEFGYAKVDLVTNSRLTQGIFDSKSAQHPSLDVWMSHGDKVMTLPDGFVGVGITESCPFAIMANDIKGFYGVQFHPEVTHTTQGKALLGRFALEICGCEPLWTSSSVIKDAIERIKARVGNNKVLLGLSGGVDSSVTALLLHQAIGDQLTCVFVDHGLLRLNEADQVMAMFANFKLNVIKVDASHRFFTALKGITDPEEKRKVIGREFIAVFDNEASKRRDINWLAQGTIYPDVIESAAADINKAHVIKSHHNVGGLPKEMKMGLIEPLRELFKDEVRKVGLELGLPYDMLYRHPFPGPGLGVRILGEVQKDYCDILRQADAIFIEELCRADLYNKVSQAFAVFLPVRSVGVMGDGRCYDWVIALRAVETIDFMTAHWAPLPYDFLGHVSNRIINEVKGISRVVYDISGKPPATIEWE